MSTRQDESAIVSWKEIEVSVHHNPCIGVPYIREPEMFDIAAAGNRYDRGSFDEVGCALK